MADGVYQYPVYFACSRRLHEQRRAVERYFSLRRRSSGGDCGPLASEGDAVYSVAFRTELAQQRVLQRSEHVVELADGTLTLTVHGSLESHGSSSIATCTPSPESTAPAQSQQATPASIPPPSGEEYELRPGKYLLRYLKECPTAGQELQTELASIACSAQLHPEEGRVVVCRLAQPGAAAEGRNWKADVDQLFDGYLCHFEVDPHKVTALHQSCSPHQATDGVKVYGEMGIAVVVGKHSQVEARLMEVEDLTVKCRRTNLVEKHTRICRLSEAKLHLLWEEIEQGVGQHFPGVKVTRKDGGQVELEGSVKDILEAGNWISDQENLVSERKVCDMRPHLLAFLRKAYGGPGELRDFLGVGGDVEIELEATELRLFSLSAYKLDDAEEALQREFREITKEVPDCSAPSSELQKRLKFKTSEMNQGQVRAQVLFGSGGTVSFLSRTKEVEELSETLTATAQETASDASVGPPADGVHVETVLATIETQQVDAVVSPMLGHDPRSTLVGKILSKIVGPQLTVRFTKEAEEGSIPGDALLLEGVTGLPSSAVLFLNLLPWDEDEEGTAVQVMRLGINTTLTTCDKKGFRSVALPLLGAGLALGFPNSVVARVLREEVHAFKQSRASRTPLLVRIVVHPSDTEGREVLRGFTEDVPQPDPELATTRIVLLGKSGTGKSTLANRIFGSEELFATSISPNSVTTQCQAETRLVNGRSITLIDTPGFFDSQMREEDIRSEMTRCITECAPGPHAFLIVLQVDRFTTQEQAVVAKIQEYFSDDALKHAVIVFTHGDQLAEGDKIEDFVSQNKNLSHLVRKCGGRCHVFDNKYWKHEQEDDYRSNRFQAEVLLETIDRMVMENQGGYYTNEKLQSLRVEIKREEERVRRTAGNLSQTAISQQAKSNVSQRLLIQLTGIATGAVLGAFFGLAMMVGIDITAGNTFSQLSKLKAIPTAAKGVSAATGFGKAAVIGVVAATGGLAGGYVGYVAAQGATTPKEAARRAADALFNQSKAVMRK